MLWLALGAAFAFCVWYFIVNPIFNLIQWWENYSDESDEPTDCDPPTFYTK